MTFLLGASNKRFADWIESQVKTQEWAIDMVTLALTTSDGSSGDVMIKVLPEVVTKHLRQILQGTNLGIRYRLRTSLSQFVCTRIFIRFSQGHDRADAQLLKINKWLVSSFSKSQSA